MLFFIPSSPIQTSCTDADNRTKPTRVRVHSRFARYCHHFILALICSGTVTLAQAQPEQDATLRFITIDVAPWASEDPVDGQLVGAFPEIISALSERTGLAMSMSITPFARVDRELESGAHDCTILIPRDQQLVVSGDLVSYHAIGVIAREGLALDDYEDLYGKIIAVLRGASIHPRFDEDPGLNKQFDTDYAISLRKLERARVDAIAGAIPTIRYIAEQKQIEDKLGDTLLLGEIPLNFQCSRKSRHLDKMPAINSAIQTIRIDGTLEKIRERHYF